MTMTTAEMIGSLEVGEYAYMIESMKRANKRISVIRKGNGFYYYEHPDFEPGTVEIGLNMGTMSCHWERFVPATPKVKYIDPYEAFSAFQNGIDLNATFKGQTIIVNVSTPIQAFSNLAPGLKITDLWGDIAWSYTHLSSN